jgi:hypothetical protein
MRGSWGRIGLLGSIIVLVGLVLVGAGIAIQADATLSTINCQFGSSPASCNQIDRTAANTTVLAEFIQGVGAIATGTGFFIVGLAVVSIMAQREASPRADEFRR